MAIKGKGASPKEAQNAYFDQTKSWETNRVLQMQRSTRNAWIIGAAGAILGLAGVIAVAGLTPLKATELRVIRVDNSTGIVDVVNALKDGKENYDEAVNKYFIQWYVRYREGYSKDLTEEYYYNTGLMSGGIEQQRYFESFNPKNPRSPITVYGAYAKVKVKVKSTSFISPNVALVRYTKEIERGTDRPSVTHWAATITFKYTSAPMSERDRGVNPLGLQVTEYRNDPDTGADVGVDAAAAAMQPFGEPPTSTVTLSPGDKVEVPAIAAPGGAGLSDGGAAVPAIRQGEGT